MRETPDPWAARAAASGTQSASICGALRASLISGAAYSQDFHTCVVRLSIPACEWKCRAGQGVDFMSNVILKTMFVIGLSTAAFSPALATTRSSYVIQTFKNGVQIGSRVISVAQLRAGAKELIQTFEKYGLKHTKRKDYVFGIISAQYFVKG